MPLNLFNLVISPMTLQIIYFCPVATYWNPTHYVRHERVVTFPLDSWASTRREADVTSTRGLWRQEKKKKRTKWSSVKSYILYIPKFRYLQLGSRMGKWIQTNVWVAFNSVYWHNMWSRVRNLGRWNYNCMESHTETERVTRRAKQKPHSKLYITKQSDKKSPWTLKDK